MSNPSRASLQLPSPADGRAIAFVGIRAWVNTRLATSGTALDASLDVVRDGVLESVSHFGDGSSASDPLTATALPQPAAALQLALTCSETDRPRSLRATGDCYANDGTPLELRGLEVTLREDVPPLGSAVGGTLLAAEPVSGGRSIDYAASDGESGLVRVEALIGETVVAARDFTGRCSFADLTACPTADRDTLSVDTRKVPDGNYPLSLRVFDAAGNRQDVQVQTVDVQNALGPQPQAIGLGAGQAQLSARFLRSARPSLIVPFGRAVGIRGRLTSTTPSTTRTGLPETWVDVWERSARAGAKEIATGRVLTHSDGRFSYKLSPRRPSRTVRLAYGSLASSPLLRVRVRAASTLEATLRGTLVRFRGRVLSLPLPSTGKLVQLEGRAPGYAWAAFARLRTDRRGRFSGSYRLEARRPGVKIQIRVAVPTQRGYPYLNYTGRPIALRVR